MTRVFLWPELGSARKENGIGRIVHAQHEHLPALGIELISDRTRADVLACHGGILKGSQVDVLHCHGMYWSDVPHAPFSAWHKTANSEIVAAAREALAITVPSDWVAEPFRRDMRIRPHIVPHGVEPELFERIADDGYYLWNKNRNFDVCDPTPALELAKRGLPVISTFLPIGVTEKPKTMTVCGQRPWEDMNRIVRRAHIYLATTMETFGVGTLEAMAAGTPVLGYAWGGTRDIVRHKIEGWLAAPGDLDGLIEGTHWIEEHYAEVARAAVSRASEFTWDKVMRRYAEIYTQVAMERARPVDRRVTVVIPCYNYGRYLGQAVESVVNQSLPPEKVIIVDDGSKDDTSTVGKALAARHKSIEYVRQKNQGVASARNLGIARAQTPFVTCLDADDWLDRHFLEACVRELVADRALGIAYTGLLVHYDDGKTRQFNWPPEFSWPEQATAKPSGPDGARLGNCIPSACVFRREMWIRGGGYMQAYAPGEDAEFWTRGLSVGFEAKRADEHRLFHYRAHSGSASRRLRYVPIDEHHPWMRDRRYPLAAPAEEMPDVLSYSAPIVTVRIHGGPNDEWAVTLDDLLGQTLRAWEVILVAKDGVPPRVREIYPFARIGLEGEARAPFLVDLKAGDTLTAIALEREIREIAAGKLNGHSHIKENEAMGCSTCPGTRKSLERAMSGMNINLPTDAKMTDTGYVRMQFIGPRVGAVTYHGLGQRSYRGGNTPMHKSANVHPEDVGLLVATGQWAIVTQVLPMPVPEAMRQEPLPPEPEETRVTNLDNGFPPIPAEKVRERMAELQAEAHGESAPETKKPKRSTRSGKGKRA